MRVGGEVNLLSLTRTAVQGKSYVEQLLVLGAVSSSHIPVALWTVRFWDEWSCNSVVQDESQQKSMNYCPLLSLWITELFSMWVLPLGSVNQAVVSAASVLSSAFILKSMESFRIEEEFCYWITELVEVFNGALRLSSGFYKIFQYQKCYLWR